MRVVAVTELAGNLEDEAGPIAALVGVSAYDVRARLAGGTPRLLLQTSDRSVSERVASGVRARGHGVIELDASDAVASTDMVRLRRFSFDASGVWANDAVGDHLAWSDVGVVVVALIRSDVERTTQEVERPGATERLTRRHAHDTTHEVTKTEHMLTHAAYLFPRRGAPARTPWLLDEALAQYRGLGASMQSTRRANFLATLARMRQLAPHAVVDDCFVTHPRTASVVLHVRGTDAAPALPAGGGVDLAVHILAEWLMRDRGGPYRG